MIKIQQVGIDLGSSNTSIAVGCDDGKFYILNDEDIKTVVYIGKSNELKERYNNDINFSEYADYKLALGENTDCGKRPEDYFFELKESLLDIEADDPERENLQDRMTVFFAKIKRCLKNKYRGIFEFDQNVVVTFGFPNCYNNVESYNASMATCISKGLGVKLKDISNESEPILATAAYFYAESNCLTEGGKIVLTLDFGGYTLDLSLCLVKKDSNGSVSITPLSIISKRMLNIGGYFITSDLSAQMYKDGEDVFYPDVEQAKCKFFESYENAELRNNGFSFPPMKREKLKDEFANCAQITIHRNLNGEKVNGQIYSIGLFTNNKEHTFSNKLERIKETVAHYLDGFSKGIDMVLFTGGTSNIKDIRDAAMGIVRSHNLRHSYDAPADFMRMLKVDAGKSKLHVRVADSHIDKKLDFSNAVAFGAALVAAKEVKIQRENSVLRLVELTGDRVKSHNYLSVIEDLLGQIRELKKENSELKGNIKNNQEN